VLEFSEDDKLSDVDCGVDEFIREQFVSELFAYSEV